MTKKSIQLVFSFTVLLTQSLLLGCGHSANSAGDQTGLAVGGAFQSGMASYYSTSLQGSKTANGETYDNYKMTAAHKTLPFNTIVVVKSLSTGKTVTVRINDRGPFVQGRIIDLSYQAAKDLGIIEKGVENVELYNSTQPTSLLGEAQWPSDT